MTGKETFITEIEKIISEGKLELSNEAFNYFESWKQEPEKRKPITENGVKVLTYMQENWEMHNNVFKAAEIAIGLQTSGRSVSGSMRKLVSDGYVEKIGKDPVAYSITEKGKAFVLTN